MSLRRALSGCVTLAVLLALVASAAAVRGKVRATAAFAATPPSSGGLPSSSFTGSGTTGGSGSSDGFQGSDGSGGGDGSEGSGGLGIGRGGTASFGAGGTVGASPSGPGGAISGLGVAAVRRLQAELARLGYFHHVVTGYYGMITTRAVEQFQRAAGLKPDGIWGPLSAAALAKQGL